MSGARNRISHKDLLAKIYEMRDAGKPVVNAGLDLRGASLTHADLSNVDFTEADLSDADLTGANLSHARLFKANLKNTSLMGANLHRADLTGARLANTNLEEADCSYAGFGMANLSNARMFSINLEGSTLSKAKLYHCDLRAAKLTNARLREASLNASDFTEANLTGADLALCLVDRAIFNNAVLRDTRLRLVKEFETAQWIGVDLRDINFAGAYTLRRFIIDQNFLKEFRNRGRSAKIVYYIWWVTSDCGRSILRWCGWIAILMVLFALIYTMVDVNFGEDSSWLAALYYSVVTMTTLGYGDIVPKSSAARIVVMLQVVIGYVMLGGLLTIFNNKLARRVD